VRQAHSQHARSTPASHEEEDLSGKQTRKSRTGAPAPRTETVRQQKRAQFEQPKSGVSLRLLLAAVSLVAVVAVAAIIVLGRGGAEAPPAAAPVAAGGEDVTIPVADLADGQAKYYSYDAGGVEVKYFVMKSSDGEYRAAFDACDVCYANKKGYSQQGGVMVCNNCGQQFDSTQINEVRGGCNPSPIDRTVDGQSLVLKTADLQTGVKYFQ
jgi:uncharacterized membrane protein